jgi:hypothetical protein
MNDLDLQQPLNELRSSVSALARFEAGNESWSVDSDKESMMTEPASDV